MGRLSLMLCRSATVLAVVAAASCSAVPAPGTQTGSTTAGPAAGPLTAQINQFRDNYSKQIIEIQLTNTTAVPMTVIAAGLRSPQFESGINWSSAAAGTELPPGQTKSLPARLPPASCRSLAQPGQAQAGQPSPDGSSAQSAVVEVRVAAAGGEPARTVTAPATDPFGVLDRNNAELCTAQAAAAVADFRLGPGLAVSADGRSAVLTLVVTPRNQTGTAGPAGAGLTLDSIGGTTLVEEDPSARWPVGLRVSSTGPAYEIRLGIRPARCDPHAVAEDKVGTLFPVRITVAGRQGILKVGASTQLKGRVQDFVTSACGRQ